MSNPFEHPVLRDWFFEDQGSLSGIPSRVVTAGSGPFNEGEFDDFLQRQGLAVEALETDLDTLILGREAWILEELDRHIELRRGRELRVFSQEMFLAFMMIGNDPYLSIKALLTFGDGHPALEYLQKSGFDWPRTVIVPSIAMGELADLATRPKVGPLKHMKYGVGRNGISRSLRQKILRRAFTSILPGLWSREYMEEWGSPNSSERLQKLANTLASLATLAKRRTNPLEQAIDEWEDDLAWLRDEFYHGRFTFAWPSTFVNL